MTEGENDRKGLQTAKSYVDSRWGEDIKEINKHIAGNGVYSKEKRITCYKENIIEYCDPSLIEYKKENLMLDLDTLTTSQFLL